MQTFKRAVAQQSIRCASALLFLIMSVSVSFASGEPVRGKEQLATTEPADTLKKAIDHAIEKVKPALVRIFVVAADYQQGREVKHEYSGSGTIITKEGYVITNHHVVRNAKHIVCTLSDKKEVEADLISTDPLTDIAVIKLRPKNKTEFPVGEFGDSSQLKVGDRVLAMGSPFALSQSVTMGIVSNTEVIIPKFHWPMDKFTIEGEDVGSIVRWIGHDASIFPGNSGGPLVNLKGEIIGINEINLGISGAIPGNLAKDVAEQLIKYGKITRSWLGLEIQPLLKDSGQEKGALVSGIIEGSPAEKASFLSGDILLKVAGKDITVRFYEEIPVFNQMIMGLPVGKETEAVVRRKDKNIVLKVTPQEQEYVETKPIELKNWGITAKDISMLNAKEMKRDSRDGVIVTTVRPGGPCWEAQPKITDHDVIVEVDGTRIKNTTELLDLTKRIISGSADPVPALITFERMNEKYLTVVKLGVEKGLQDQGFEARKPWLPVAMQVMTKDIAKKLGLEEYTGMLVTQVYDTPGAKKMGFRVGDLIVALEGERIPVSSPEDYEVLPAMIRQYRIGSKVTLTIIRGKEKLITGVELEQSPLLPGEMKKYVDSNFDFTVRDVSFMDNAQEGWKVNEGGVLVEAVGEGGWASLARLSVGDLILSAEGKPVPDVSAMEKIMKDIAQKKSASVLLQVRRGIHTLFIEMETRWNGNV